MAQTQWLFCCQLIILNKRKKEKTMIILKELADFFGIKNECMLGIQVAQSVANDLGIDIVLTSGTDWFHKETSQHYRGEAFDLDFIDSQVSEEIRKKFIEKYRSALNSDYIIIDEKSHIHTAFKPTLTKREKIYIKSLESKGYKII